MIKISDLSSPSTCSRILIYCATDKGHDLIKESLCFQEDVIDYATTVDEAKAMLASARYSSLIADFTQLDFTGKELMLWTQSHCPNTKVFYLAHSATPDVDAEVWNVDLNGMFRHVGHQHDSITPLLNTLLTEHPTNSWAANVSKEFMKVRKRLDNRRGGIILIIGASGTGKYALSQIAHFRSTRGDNPFVFVNCKYHGNMKAFQWSEQETSLFHINMRNIMTMANGGTLYFHEIDHLAMNVQNEIANILKSGLVNSPNGKNFEKFSGLIICSSRHNLEELVRVNEFSVSLFQTINENVVRLPSLSDYKDEIIPIAEEILSNYCVMKKIKVKSFTKDASSRIAKHVWVRNIRELYETVKNAVDLCEGMLLKGEHILFEVSRNSSDEKQSRRCQIKQALVEAKGNRTEAARILGVTRKTLYKWMEECDIPHKYGKPEHPYKSKKNQTDK